VADRRHVTKWILLLQRASGPRAVARWRIRPRIAIGRLGCRGLRTGSRLHRRLLCRGLLSRRLLAWRLPGSIGLAGRRRRRLLLISPKAATRQEIAHRLADALIGV